MISKEDGGENMIIRLSVNDNDFSNVIEEYLSGLWSNLVKTDVFLEENTIELFGAKRKINEILNPNIDYKLKENDKIFLENQIRKSFRYWCGNHYPCDADYLSRNIAVEFLDVMKDKWENGEACYWFQHSSCVITQ